MTQNLLARSPDDTLRSSVRVATREGGRSRRTGTQPDHGAHRLRMPRGLASSCGDRSPTMAPMSRQFPTGQAVPAIAPVYPFNEPGQPVVLYDGPIGALAAHDAPGVVELSCLPDLNVVWRIEASSMPVGAPGDSVTLVLRRPSGDARVPGVWRERTDGWSNGAAIGKADVPLTRIVTHWFNLPDLHVLIDTATTEIGD